MISNTVETTVEVPVSPTMPIDIERLTASAPSVPVTASAYLVTIAHRHAFSDVADDFWADDVLQYLVSQGVVSGYSDGSFRPNDNVTRAQFAKMLVGAMGWDIQTPAAPTFNDVAADSWAYGFIETAAAHGVISGYGDGSFKPELSVTRAQVAKMIVTARGWTMDVSGMNSFSDIDASEWVHDYAEIVNQAQVMSGYTDGTFKPYYTATRAQIAKILTLSLFNEPNN